MVKVDEKKQVMERVYVVPLRKGWLKVPKYKRAKKATKILREFIARHMKLYGDLKKVKLDIDLNNEIRFKGMKKPPAKIMVKAKKFEDGIVKVELVNIPKHIEFARLREKEKAKVKKKEEEEKKEEKIEVAEERKEESEEIKEKKESSREEGLMLAKKQARELKHISKEKKVRVERLALGK